MKLPIQKTFMTLAEFHTAAPPPAAAAGPSTVVHLLNPFPALPGSEHHRAQAVTLRSMAQARTVAAALDPGLAVRFVAASLEDLPADMTARFDEVLRLDRSIGDLGAFQVPRPLPLVFDILDAPRVGPDDILLFTNTDIALAPQFYLFLDRLFRRGADAVVINRRTISAGYGEAENLDMMSCEAGVPHPGFDCFAFRGRLRDGFVRSQSCVGISLVMLPLLYNLLATATAPAILLDAHATFHLGNDRQWQDDRFHDYEDHNRRELARTFEALVAGEPHRDQLLARLRDAHRGWVFPNALREKVGEGRPAPGRLAGLMRRGRRRLGAAITGG